MIASFDCRLVVLSQTLTGMGLRKCRLVRGFCELLALRTTIAVVNFATLLTAKAILVENSLEVGDWVFRYVACFLRLGPWHGDRRACHLLNVSTSDNSQLFWFVFPVLTGYGFSDGPPSLTLLTPNFASLVIYFGL